MRVAGVRYNSLMTSRQALHEVIDTLDDEFVTDLLGRIAEERARSLPQLTRDDKCSILRGLQEAIEGKGISHDEAMRLAGLD